MHLDYVNGIDTKQTDLLEKFLPLISDIRLASGVNAIYHISRKMQKNLEKCEKTQKELIRQIPKQPETVSLGQHV